MSTARVQLKQESFRFAENISVKGISRILKARNTVYRVLWSIAVVTSLCILLWQLSTVFMKYFTYPVDTLIEDSSDEPLFPDVTICNIYPTSILESMLEKISWPTYTEAFSEAQKISTSAKFRISNNLSDEDYYYMLIRLGSRTGYFANFPIIEEDSIFDDKLMKSNEVYNWQWRLMNSKTCVPIHKNQWNPNYYACHTLSVPEKCQRDIRGMTMNLYIHNFPELLQLGYNSGDMGSQASGVLIAFHAPGTSPNLKMAYSVGPGTENNIRLFPTIRTLLPSPYSNCTEQKYIQSETDFTGKKLLYTKDVCIDVCLQQQILNEFKCLSVDFQFTPEQRFEANGIVCGNLSLLENISLSSIAKGMDDYLCSAMTPLDQKRCDNECLNQCDELSYEFTTSSAPWPHVSTQLIFADAMKVLSPSYESKFNIYRSILDEYNSNGNSSETLRQLGQTDLIQKNFLQLNIFFEGYRTMVLRDVPSLTPEKLLGIIGGTLSLWLGISIMTLVEVMEFICTLVHLYIQKNKIAEKPA